MRQNTPHPKELKAKAHKLFAKGQNSLEDSSDVNTTANETPPPPPRVIEAVNPNVQQPRIEQEHQETGNGHEEGSEEASADEDTDDVSEVFLLVIFQGDF